MPWLNPALKYLVLLPIPLGKVRAFSRNSDAVNDC